MARSKYTAEQKITIIQEFKENEITKQALAKRNGLSPKTIDRWLECYRRLGKDGLIESKSNTKYSKELKYAAVNAYLVDHWPATKVLKFFGIRSITQLETWVRRYNGSKELTDTPSSRRIPDMTRKTTYEERVEIVEYALAHSRNYNETAKKYEVSYQQVYLWVKKVDIDGFPALVDRRGRTKSTDEMTELEKAKLRIRQLEAENKSNQMAIDFAKKLQEILERGR